MAQKKKKKWLPALETELNLSLQFTLLLLFNDNCEIKI